MNYKILVIEGKLLVKKLDHIQDSEISYQAQIAKYAIDACDIRYDGESKKTYSLKSYAEDIGVKRNTLSQWVRVYVRVVQRMKMENPTNDEWMKASKVAKILKYEIAAKNKADGKVKSKINGQNNYNLRTDSDIKKIYNTLNEKPFVQEFSRLNEYSIHIKNLLIKRDLGIIEDFKLTQLMARLDLSADLINDHLTEKKKKEMVRGLGLEPNSAKSQPAVLPS